MNDSTSDREIIISRTFNAPRELVFDAFTDPAHIGNWWGPNGFTTTTHEMEVKPGGTWRYIMHGPDGTNYDNKIVYLEVTRPERLVYDHGEDDGPPHFQTTITFEEEAGKTNLKMRLVFPTKAARDNVINFGAIEGGNQTLNRLAEFLAK